MKSKNENERETIESTAPLNSSSQKPFIKRSNTTNGAKTKIKKCDLGIDFVPPDGGWGWLVVIAAGCSNVRIELRFDFFCTKAITFNVSANDKAER